MITIGAITAFFTGLLGIVQQDIKRVIAYSTLSQLGYMTVALGASAYAAGIFHLMTHAFFKALLFFAAGSVIIAMHHEQDIRKMGGLRKYLPITYWTSVIGTLALIGFPGFSGFFSKDALIEAVHASTTPGHTLAYWAVLIGVFITSLYSFRLLFVVFHGKERMDHHTKEHLHETPWVVTGPLIALAIPSVIIGWLTIGPGAVRRVLRGRDLQSRRAEPARDRRRGVSRACGVRAARLQRRGGLSRARGRDRRVVPVFEAPRHSGAPADDSSARCTTCS